MNPLDQLNDITLPSDVSIWPLAWGYWLLIGLTSVFLVFVGVNLWRKHKYKLVQRWALNELTKLEHDAEYFSHTVQSVIKRYCTHYYAEHSPHLLNGDRWHHFLLSQYTGNNSEAVATAIKQLSNNLYAQQNGDLPAQLSNAEIKTLMTSWITNTLPPYSKQEVKHV